MRTTSRERQTPAARVSPLPELDTVVRDARRKLHESDHVQNCLEYVRLLSTLSHIFPKMLLIGFSKDVTNSRLRILKSASFLVDRRNSASLAATPRYLQIERPTRRPDAIATHLGFDPRRDKISLLGNSACYFQPGRDITIDASAAECLRELAMLFNLFLIRSQNFDNFIGGEIYSYSKPKHNFLFHPKFDSFNALCKALRSAFKVEAQYYVYLGSRTLTEVADGDLRTDQNRSISTSVRFFSNPRFKKELGTAINLKQAIFGLIQGGSSEETSYCIFPFFDASIRGSPIEGVLLVWSNKGFPQFAYRAAHTWLREFSAKRHIQKASFLTDFKTQVEAEIGSLSERSNCGRIQRRRSLKRVGAYLCKGICRLTNAENASLRLLHHSTGIIRRYGHYATPLGQYKSGVEKARPNYDIRSSEWRHSANAFAFEQKAFDKAIYLANVSRIPPQYRKEGFKSALLVHEHTRCEAVIKVWRGDLLTAILNVESPIEGSLEKDLNFLRSCGEVVSQFLSRLETVSDRKGLATMAHTHLETHAIKDFVQKWRPGQTDLAVYIVQRLKDAIGASQTGHAADAEFAASAIRMREINSVRALNESFVQSISNWLVETGSDASLSPILRGRVQTDFPPDGLPSLMVVLHSIFENIVEHSLLEKNRITLSTRSNVYGAERLLCISWRCPIVLPSSISRDRLFLEPLFRNDGPHFGLFLIGVHARMLGGHVELLERQSAGMDNGFTVQAFIPYKPGRK